MIFVINTTRDISKLSQITYNNFEISLVVFMPNITTNHAITYTNTERQSACILAEDKLTKKFLASGCNNHSLNELIKHSRRASYSLYPEIKWKSYPQSRQSWSVRIFQFSWKILLTNSFTYWYVLGRCPAEIGSCCPERSERSPWRREAGYFAGSLLHKRICPGPRRLKSAWLLS